MGHLKQQAQQADSSPAGSPEAALASLEASIAQMGSQLSAGQSIKCAPRQRKLKCPNAAWLAGCTSLPCKGRTVRLRWAALGAVCAWAQQARDSTFCLRRDLARQADSLLRQAQAQLQQHGGGPRDSPAASSLRAPGRPAQPAP